MTEKTYQVFRTLTAQQDLKRTIEYIAVDSKVQAKRVYFGVKLKILYGFF